MVENEKLSILKMVASGRLTAEEGLRLLEALGPPKRQEDEGGARPARRLRVTVTELGTGRRRAQANLPMPLVDLALRFVARSAGSFVNVAGHRVDADTLLEAVHDGTPGRVLDLVDDRENVKLEVFLE